MNNLNQHHLDSIFYKGTDVWPQLAGRRVFVGGSNGFYGAAFMAFFRHLRETQGLVFDYSGGSRRNGWDITQPTTYPSELLTADYVINCAGCYGPDMSEMDLIMNHVGGPVSLRAHMRADATLLQFSSGSAKEAKTPMGAAKAASEYHLYQTTLPLQVVRPYATVGPGMGIDKHFAVSAWIKARLEGRPAEVTSTLTIRSFAHIVDLVIQSLHVMVAGDGEPYEVGSDDWLMLEEAAALICDEVVTVDKTFSSLAGEDTYVADLTRVKQHFNLDLAYDSRAAILDTVRYWFGER